MIKYDVRSRKADEFINHGEITDTLKWAEENRENIELVNSILDRAADCGGLTHREAALLLECGDRGAEERIFSLAGEIKERFYGSRIVMFAPLYLSNYCVNGCVYCPYHGQNRHIEGKSSLRMK